MATSIEPLAWFVGEFGDGVRLTAGGRVPRSLLLRADARYHWFADHPVGSIRLEEDLHEVRAMHEMGRRLRLLTLRNGRLRLSAAGRRTVEDPLRLWRLAVEALFSPGLPAGDASGILAAILLAEDEPVTDLRDARERTVAILRSRWRGPTGEDAGPYGLCWATWDFAALARAFGWVHQTGQFLHPRWSLTPAGRIALAAGLRHQATEPRWRP